MGDPCLNLLRAELAQAKLAGKVLSAFQQSSAGMTAFLPEIMAAMLLMAEQNLSKMLLPHIATMMMVGRKADCPLTEIY